MWKKTNSLPAFSLAEMLVVMLLSGLAAGIVYFAYYTVNRYHLDLTRKSELVSDVHSLQYLVNRDFERCEYVSCTTAGFMCLSRDSAVNSEYHLLAEGIVRNQVSRSDTFHVTPLAAKFLFKNKPVTTNTFDVFYLEAICLADTIVMKFVKEYDASSLVYHHKHDTIW